MNADPIQGRNAQYCVRLSRLISRWWARYILGPIFVTAPPGVVLAFYRFKLDAHLPAAWAEYLHNHQLHFLVLCGAWVYVLTAAHGWVEHCARKYEGIDVKGLLALFETLEEVVRAKAVRFEGALKQKAESSRPTASAVFQEITKPEQQIALLGRAIHGFFSSISEGVAFKVTIAEIDKSGMPTNWLQYIPEIDSSPKTPIDFLRNPESTICRAVEKKDLVIVEDRKAEAQKRGGTRNHVSQNPKDLEDGSVLCYPVYDVKIGVPYAVTIVANKRKYFSEANRPIYEWALKKFVLRIRLEHSLLLLKQSAIN